MILSKEDIGVGSFILEIIKDGKLIGLKKIIFE